MTVRWRTEQPNSGYEALTISGRWVAVLREDIEAALNKGEMVTWNPTGGKL